MRRGLLCALAIAAVSVAAPRGARWNFIPDWTFKGNELKKDWTVLGQATWQAANGELIGTPTSPEGGWLVLNKGLQDFQFGADLKCSAECKAGVLHGLRLGAVHLLRTGFHDGPRVLRGGDTQPVNGLPVQDRAEHAFRAGRRQLGGVCLRLHRRRLAGRPAREYLGQRAVREPQG
jgi:hypothetical protein